MRLLAKFTQFFGFTPTESKVILFLAITFLVGSAIRLYKISFPADSLGRFDYTKEEEQFSTLSKTIDSLEAAHESRKELNKKGSTKKTSPTTSGSRKITAVQPGKAIDLNKASKNELMRLPGIGEAMAERILLYREEVGKFDKVEDLKKVRGIGEKRFQKLRPLVTVE